MSDPILGKCFRLGCRNSKELSELRARIAELERLLGEAVEGLKDASECVVAWSSYASDYFREKHDLDGDLARIAAIVAKAEGGGA